MPTKIETETQLLRLLSNTPLQVDVYFIRTASYTSKNTKADHLDAFYTTFDAVKNQFFDGLIVTGAPVEHIPYEEVEYWYELKRIMNWSRNHVFSVFHICWGAGAGLYHHYGIEKHNLPKKISGIFPQKVIVENHKLFKGFDDVFLAPHSRYTEILEEDILRNDKLKLLSTSDKSGVYIVSDKTERMFFITGHPEYDKDTIKREYERDLQKGANPGIPYNYFPDDNPKIPPLCTWRSHASLLYFNWLNFCVYQRTPYDLHKIRKLG
jgi:homoserine O-succinyltransferase